MKKIYSLLLLNMLVCSLAFGQMVPRGMKYQAVARDLTGAVMANQEIALKINLTSPQAKGGQVHYSETHTVTTNQFGLFTLTVGEGKVGSGGFSAIPWSSEDIWMEVAIGDKGKSSFATLSSSKLLAVPYAIHAATASELVGSKFNPMARAAAGDPGVPSQTWSLFGNSKSEETKDKLGTTDYMGLIFVTNNIERLKITRDGDINIANTLNVGKDVNIGRDLTVDRNVYLNKGSTGETINYGPFTVQRLSPTYLTGTLKVDGITTVTNPTESTGKTTGALVVEGGTGIGKNLNVGGNTDLDGTLNVDGVATVSNTTESTAKNNGALVVKGGVGIEKNINVGGNGDVDGTLNVDGITTISNTTESTAKNNGALVVVGGVGIGKNINIGGNADIDGTLNTDGATTLKNTLVVDGATTLNNTLNVVGNTTIQGLTNITNTTQSTLSTNGAFIVAGGVGIGKNLNVGGSEVINGDLNVKTNTDLDGTLNVDGASTLNNPLTLNSTAALNGQVTITANVGNAEDNYDSYPLRVTGNEQGIIVKLTSSKPQRGNNYLTFMNGGGTATGRIEGFEGIADGVRSAVNDLVGEGSDDASQDRNQDVPANIPTGAANYFNTNYGFGAFQLTLSLIDNIIRLTTNAIACAVGIGIAGDCDDIFWSSVDVIVGGIQLGGYIGYNEQTSAAGVAYESGGADYAEWLQRANSKEMLTYGDVVGVKGGVISRSFVEAEKFMVISNKPAVIGGMPEAGKEKQYAKVAFMGQVPVKVVGRACKGDYILPSGSADGMAIAIAPGDMKARDYGRIIGIAWSEADPKKVFNYINTAVGINSNDMAGMIEQMQGLLNNMQVALQKAVPEYKPMFYAVDQNQKPTLAAVDYTKAPSLQETVVKNVGGRAQYASLKDAMQGAKSYAATQGVNLSQYPLMNEFFNNPTPEMAQKVQDHYMKALARAQNLLARMEQSKPAGNK
ncbi:hypothetical protein [Spirosoma luteum]|uniref:hypothetical protein n=1 Tax=Spirosoma luteum TaxID=431553 RepID=UPI00036DCDDF|nr:hypothetical protein [Spirosoma luteum]